MLLENSKTTTKRESKAIVREKMAEDLIFLLESYNNKDIGLRIISEKTGISEKTLRRVRDAASDPHVKTVRKFYHYFLKVHNERREDDTELKEALKGLIDSFEVGNQKRMNFDLAELLEKDSVFRKIYLYSRSGSISLEWVKDEFGKYGVDMVQKMLMQDVLVETDKGVYTQGAMSVARSHDAVRNIIGEMMNEHVTDEQLDMMNQASLFYVIEGVSRELKLEVGRMTQEYRNNLAKLLLEAKDKGDERLFVFGGVGSLKEMPAKFMRRIQ